LHMIGTNWDITESKCAEEKLKKVLQEKELLLREVHHRVKNNMNAMMSLLSLQADSVENAEAAAALNNARNRLQSMQVLYDKLYRSRIFEKVSVREYLSSLIAEIIHNYPTKVKVLARTEIDDFSLSAQAMSSLGILINELLTNTMKYAFVGRADGLITVCTAKNGERVRVTVNDDGVGIPESIDIGSSTGFGLQLVQMLAEQLEGTIRIERGNGTKYVLEFDV
jgi:two-component sensor histidine kinase